MENQIYRCNRLLVRRKQITSALPFLFNVRWGWVRQNSLFLARLQQLKFSRIQELVKVKFAGRFSQRSFCLRQVCYLISWADRMTKSLRRLVLQLSAMKRYDFGTVSKAQNLAEKLFFGKTQCLCWHSVKEMTLHQSSSTLHAIFGTRRCRGLFFFVKGSTWSAGDPCDIECIWSHGTF